MSTAQEPTEERDGGSPGVPNARREGRLLELVEPICAAHGVELVQLRWLAERGGSVLRVFIDRPSAGFVPAGSKGAMPEADAMSGVTHEDCTRVSRDLSTTLDVHEGVVSGNYRLEVSSPGLDRPLVKLAHFERFLGREAKVKLHEPVEDRRSFQGTLLRVEGELIHVEVDGKSYALPHSLISKANLVFRFE